MAPDLLEVAARWRPDLIVREAMEYGGCLAAEKIGIPHASIGGNGYSAVDSPDIHYFPGNRRMVAEPMSRHRRALGLAADPANLMPFRHLHLCFTPPAWDGEEAPRPPNTRFVRHQNATRPGASLPDWVETLPERPTVLASLGTVFNTTTGVLEAIVEGLGGEDVNAIVAIGPDRDPAAFGEVPENVRLEPYVPQSELLARCDAFVTHAGFNSVKESLVAGVPIVAVPITADQPYCAERCAALGVGRVVDRDERTPEAIRRAARDVLGQEGYRTAAAAFREEMLALPGPEEMTALLEGLAGQPSDPIPSRATAV
jgi:UDP:flavonoid glycosyltransferase YjiC (YdhE family)